MTITGAVEYLRTKDTAFLKENLTVSTENIIGLDLYFDIEFKFHKIPQTDVIFRENNSVMVECQTDPERNSDLISLDVNFCSFEKPTILALPTL